MKIWDEGWVSVETREWQTVATHTYVWDGNLPVHETVQRSNGSTVERSYFWGMDKSGTEQGAGGVGGLLAVSVNGAFFIPCYDHNGNIVRYVAENGSAAAQYTYDPYGNTIEAAGQLANEFPFGFSTKYHDRETGLVYYLMRFYNPPHGRWLNRDPIEEEGGENLYEYCGNSPAHSIDTLGMAKVCDYLCEAALRWSHHRFHLDYERYVQDSIIVSAWKKCYERIAPKSVKEGVETALARLNVRGVTVGEGTPLKATVSGDIFCNLSKSGHFPKRTMTVSSSHAWSVALTGPWELKIYEESENVFGAAVGYKTQSFAHYLDFGLYAFSLMGLGQTVPNSYNAEDYVGHVYIDEEARSALNRYSNILALDSL